MPNSNETPRGAVEEILSAITDRDYNRLTSRVDLTEFINIGYDEAIEQLASRCEEFHQKYPDDLLFKFGAQAIRDYNAQYRLLHIGYLFAVINQYFGGDVDTPKAFNADPIGCSAYHLNKLIKSLHATVVDAGGDDVTVEVTADGDYQQLIGTLTFRLRLMIIDDHWRLIKIANAAELVEPIVDIGEKIWPREWDRGIRI